MREQTPDDGVRELARCRRNHTYTFIPGASEEFRKCWHCEWIDTDNHMSYKDFHKTKVETLRAQELSKRIGEALS